MNTDFLRQNFGGSRFFLYVLLATLAAVIPSTLLTLATDRIAKAFGSNIADLAPVFEPLTPFRLFFGTALGPLIETLVLIIAIRLFLRLFRSEISASAAAAFVCSAAHGLVAPLWFIGTIWNFFVFSYSFVLWRSHSFPHALLASYLPHALLNAIIFTWIALYPA